METERVNLSAAYRYRIEGEKDARVYGPGENIEIPAEMAAALREQRALSPAGDEAPASDTGPAADGFSPGETPIPDNFPARSMLIEAGYTTIEAVAALSKRQLTDLDGIGDATADRIIEAAQAGA